MLSVWFNVWLACFFFSHSLAHSSSSFPFLVLDDGLDVGVDFLFDWVRAAAGSRPPSSSSPCVVVVVVVVQRETEKEGERGACVSLTLLPKQGREGAACMLRCRVPPPPPPPPPFLLDCARTDNTRCVLPLAYKLKSLTVLSLSLNAHG